MWIAERLQEQAALELNDDERLRRELEEARIAFELGEISQQEYEQAEADVLARFDASGSVVLGPRR